MALADTFSKRVITLFETIHPLDRIARAGYVLRGVPEPESIAAHSHFVSLMTLLFVEQYPDRFDRHKALTMAIVHDLAESKIMDIPMPAADAHFREVKEAAEQHVTEELLGSFGEHFAAYQAELSEGKTPEARLVRGLDKAQMMMKIVMYEREGKGRLAEFWDNPKNFADFGIDGVSDFFDALCKEAGRSRPR